MATYQQIFAALNDSKIRYIIVGGVAMNLLGVARFTGDIDILLALDEKNLLAMATLMKKMKYEKRVPISLDELGDEKKVLDLIKKKNLIAYTFVNDSDPLHSIDVIIGDSLHFADFEKHSAQIPVWDISVPVVSVDDLIKMKKKTRRKKDDIDVSMLLQLKDL
mgnify:CR=1 FL=1